MRSSSLVAAGAALGQGEGPLSRDGSHLLGGGLLHLAIALLDLPFEGLLLPYRCAEAVGFGLLQAGAPPGAPAQTPVEMRREEAIQLWKEQRRQGWRACDLCW